MPFHGAASDGKTRVAERILESSADAIVAADRDFRVVAWNAAMERLSSRCRDEVLGRSLFELFPLLRENGADRHMRAALEGSTSVTEDGRAFCADNPVPAGFTTRWAPLLTEGGEIAGIVGSVRASLGDNNPGAEPRPGDDELRQLFEEAPVAYHEIDRDGIIRRVNRAECLLLGFDRNAMLGRPAWEFVVPEQRDASRDAVRRKIGGEKSLAPFQRTFMRRDGARVVLEVHENYTRGADGSVTGIRTALLDVTDRNRVEEELRRAHDHLEQRVHERTVELAQANQRLALEYGVGQVLAQASGLAAAAPELLYKMCGSLGWKRATLWMREPAGGWLRFACDCDARPPANPADRTETVDAIAALAFEARKPVWIGAGENRASGAAGAGLILPVFSGGEPAAAIAMMSGAALPPDHQLLEIAAVIATQVGQFIDRKRAEGSLQQSEARFAAFMRHLPGIAFMKDLAGRYVFYNAAAETLLERRPDDFVGKTDEEIWPAEIAATYRANDRLVLEGSGPLEIIEPVPHPNGTHEWLIYKFAIPGPDGKPEFIGGVGVDITERSLLEEQLRQSQKMEAIGRLAGGVAHDFNNLLTIISGYGRMLVEDLPPKDRARSRVEEILNAADRAAVLTSQLLAFSRRQVVQPRVIALNHVVSNMEKMLRRVIGEHIQLETKLSDDLVPVKADPGQVEQIVMNLAVNARDAMQSGGTLTIATTNVVLPGKEAGAPPRPSVELTISDTGVGMTAEVMSHLFEPFFTTKGRGKGTGLGLSTVYGIVKQHGGDLQVESEPGRGARFRIFLPQAQESAEAASKRKRARRARRGTETILLVEDEPGVRQLASSVLRRHGYKVLEAGDGNEALQLAAGEPNTIHLLLTDVIMPLMSGRELADKLKAARKSVRTLYMSGYTDDVIAYRGELGPDAEFLQKPFGPDVLTRRVREILDEDEQG